MNASRTGLAARAAIAAWNVAGRAALANFERRAASLARVNELTLRAILARSRKSLFGRDYGFTRILASRDVFAAYRAAVPLRDYDHHRQYIDLMAAGRQGVLTGEPVLRFAGSAGTTGPPKRLPVTASAVRQFALCFGLIQRGALHRLAPQACAGGAAIGLLGMQRVPAPARAPSAAVVSLPQAGIAALRGWLPFRWSSPDAAFEISDARSMLFLHALFGLARRDVTSITALFGPHLAAWFQLIERHCDSLADSIERGRLPGDLQLTGPERGAIEMQLRPDRGRAEEIRRALETGREHIMVRLWPRMRCLTAGMTGGFAACVPWLRRLAGPDVLLFSPAHAASEAVVGVNTGPDPLGDCTLAAGAAVFEFIPAAEIAVPQPQTVLPQAVTVGETYEVVLTTRAGLYRYRLADLVRITGFYGSAPQFRFLYRHGVAFDLAGEKVSEALLAGVVDAWLANAAAAGDALTSCALTTDRAGAVGHYRVFVEGVFAEPISEPVTARLAADLDSRLTRGFSGYRRARLAGHIALPQIAFVRPGTFAELPGIGRQACHPQAKPVRVVSDPRQVRCLERGMIAVMPRRRGSGDGTFPPGVA